MTTEQNRTPSTSSLGNTTPFYSNKKLPAKLTRMPINADINKQFDLKRFSLRRTNLNGDFLRFRQTKFHPRLALVKGPPPDARLPTSFYSSATGFLSVPMPPTLTSTTSPATTGPTPSGVPVGIKSPGMSVMNSAA